MEGKAHQDSHNAHQNRQCHQLNTADQGQGGRSQGKGFRMGAQGRRQLAGSQGGQIAGQQCRGENGSHGGKLHGKQGCGEGRTEQPGEYRRHAGHGHHCLFVFLQVKQPSQQGSAGAAQLQGRPFPSGGTAQEVSDGGGQEDGRGDGWVYIAIVKHSVNDFIGAPVVFQAKPPIDGQGQQAAQRQQIQHPGVLSPGLGDKGQGVVKTRPQKSPYNADKDTQGAPFEQGFSILFRMMECFNQ